LVELPVGNEDELAELAAEADVGEAGDFGVFGHVVEPVEGDFAGLELAEAGADDLEFFEVLGCEAAGELAVHEFGAAVAVFEQAREFIGVFGVVAHGIS